MKIGFTKDERIAFYDAVTELDKTSVYINADKNMDTLSYTKKIKTHENISGRPNDEELTRALIILQLIYLYNYSAKAIEIENSFHIGGHNKLPARAVETDICIKNNKGEIELLFEVKRLQDYDGTDDSCIEDQLFYPHNTIVKFNKVKYLFHVTVDVPLVKNAFPLQCIGIDTSISKTYKEWSDKGKVPHLLDIVSSGEKPILEEVYVKLEDSSIKGNKKFKDLDDNFEISTLKRKWRILWDYIWGGKLDDNKKFENFNKVLLAKIYDERKTKLGASYRFQRKFVGNELQSDESIAHDVDLLYKKAFREYLSKDKDIELFKIKGIDFKEFSPSLVSKCVELFGGLSFNKNRYKNVDILGEFYEMVIRDTFKQSTGLFLTHPNIVLFILSALDVEEVVTDRLKYPAENHRYRMPLVIDPSCGTGTFLVNYMNYIQKYIEENHKKISGGDDDIKDFIERNVLDKYAYKWVLDYVYGIDIEPVLATACQINLILHGDGSTNIYNASGLDSFKEYSNASIRGATNILSSDIKKPTTYYDKNTLGKFDFIVSNPPFNVKTSVPEEDFSMPKGKSEAFFLERWYQLLCPSGRIGVVLPESFFSVEDDIEGRYFLYKHFNVKAIVALPIHTFSPHTMTNTSLLFASKKTIEEEKKFDSLWKKYLKEFKKKQDIILNIFPTKKSEVSFNNSKEEKKKNIRVILNSVESKFKEEFHAGFLTIPFFQDEYIFDDDNYGKIKNTIKTTLKKLTDRWILHQVSRSQQNTFYNFSVDEIGYKAGIKGSKNKPNELMTVLDEKKNQVYDIKYAHSWDKIDIKDLDTVLGQIKELRIWQ